MNFSAVTQRLSARQLAVFIIGFCCFINLYSPQPILPLLSAEFGASAAQVSTVITAGTLAVALIAPFAGTVADVLGRKYVIVTAMIVLVVPTLMSGLAPTLPALVGWRFVEGLVMPPIFAVTVAYIGEEWPRREAATAAGIYSSGSSLGGFTGRLLTGVLADWIGWRGGLEALAGITLVGAIVIMLLLPRERNFVRSEGLLASGKQMLRHFRNTQLVATYAVGFGVLFNFIAIFTYISFRLAVEPYNLSAGVLGLIFVVYLAGSVLAPLSGWLIGTFGRRRFMVANIAVSIGGVALTLASPLWLVILGLTVCAACGLLCQAISTGYVTITAQAGRSSAVGLYVMSFYLGGSFGGALGGVAWSFGGWPACVAVVMLVQIGMASIVFFAWTPHVPPARADEPA
jgi:predicted MFS family arabinose efflux permease